jgi:alkanesulfonate monooxygenase SsuD/methylene tetrahydromethanopterin reductase-like flavin-dependent oxidoreductase (luciferase family)
MRFGIYAGPLFPSEKEMSRADAFKAAVRMSEAAHASGFDGIFCGHHYLIGEEGQMHQPVPMLSYLAGRFPDMYFGTCVYLLPLRHPVTVAEEIATLDFATGGKLLFGVGQGYRDVEFNSLNLQRKDRGPQMIESLAALRTLWAGANASFHGNFYNFDNVTLGAQPMSKQGPPILVAADIMKTVRRVPQIGDHWLPSPRHSRSFLDEAVPAYREELDRCGRSFTGLPLPREMFIARDGRIAERIIQDAFEEMYHRYHRMGQPGERYDHDFETLKRERLVVGNPSEVAEQILGYHQDYGAEFMWFRLYWPGLDLERSLEAIHLFGEEVLPAVKRETGQGNWP